MIKVGDIVSPKVGSYFHKSGDRWTGIVCEINLWEDGGPPSPENHGTIEIRLLTVENYYLDPGDLEHFAFWGWEDNLEIVNNGSEAK